MLSFSTMKIYLDALSDPWFGRRLENSSTVAKAS